MVYWPHVAAQKFIYEVRAIKVFVVLVTHYDAVVKFRQQFVQVYIINCIQENFDRMFKGQKQDKITGLRIPARVSGKFVHHDAVRIKHLKDAKRYD